jgi:1-acyl-sn-glycerol-3-phosphate acyltransferase
VIWRASRRAVALAFTIFICFLRLGWMRLRGPLSLEQQARFMQANCRLTIKALGIHCHITGQPPTSGLLVANHLSYLDILILGAAQPCFFVSKSEIRNWPFFGQLGSAGGTIFLKRSSRTSTEKVAATIAERLKLPIPILFFPEGTSTDGSSVLRFHNRFFEPGVVAGATITAASVRYVLEDGTPERELCWFGDAPFLPHLGKALHAAGFHAEVHFGEPHVYPDRRTASTATHAEISALRGRPSRHPRDFSKTSS